MSIRDKPRASYSQVMEKKPAPIAYRRNEEARNTYSRERLKKNKTRSNCAMMEAGESRQTVPEDEQV